MKTRLVSEETGGCGGWWMVDHTSCVVHPEGKRKEKMRCIPFHCGINNSRCTLCVCSLLSNTLKTEENRWKWLTLIYVSVCVFGEMAMSWSNDALCFSLAGLSAFVKNVFTLLNPHTDLPPLGSPSVCLLQVCEIKKINYVLSLNPPIAISSRSLCFCSLWSVGMRHQDAIKLGVRASDPSRWSTSLIVLLNFISICLSVCVCTWEDKAWHACWGKHAGWQSNLIKCACVSIRCQKVRVVTKGFMIAPLLH